MRTPKQDHLLIFFLSGLCLYLEVWDVSIRPSKLVVYRADSLEPEGVWE